MARRSGWAAFSVLSWALAVLSAVGAVVGAIVAAGHRDVGAILLTLVGGALVATFWRWMALGAWARADGRVETTPVGPWGVVGRVLMLLIVVGLVGAVIWAEVSTRKDDDRANRTRDRSEQAAEDQHLTVADVQSALAARSHAPVGGPESRSIERLLDISGARVVDASVEGDHASLLIWPDDRLTKCVVLTVDGAGVIDGRTTDRCAVGAPTAPR